MTGIATTTHIDRHYERFSKSALEGMADQIKQKYIPNLVDHDPNKQIGIILYGEVFRLADGEYALGVVTGVFEDPQEQSEFKNGDKNTVWYKYIELLNVESLIKMQQKNSDGSGKYVQRKRSDLSLVELLEIHLNSTQVAADGKIYKIKKFIASTGDLRFEVYPKDHENQPHFHVISKQRGINARFDIDTLELISIKQGAIRPSDVKKIQSFFRSKFMRKKLKEEHARLN